MSVLPNYPTFRAVFAKYIPIVGSFSFTNVSVGGTFNARISRAAGDFIADGVKVGMTVQATGSASNDGFRFHVASTGLTTGYLDMVPQNPGNYQFEPLAVGEGPTACTLNCVTTAFDGYEEFPGLFAGNAGRYNLVRSAGFTGGFTGIPTPYAGTQFTVTCNGGAADATFQRSDYVWYLSQRSDVAAKQYLTIAQLADSATQSFSGSVTIVHNALATSELAISGVPSVDQVIQLFRFCDLYVRRQSDGAIQWVSLLRAMFKAA